ncbi:MAG: hypothetical protein VXX91_03975 [Planctomycetota bacterium]|nr:hypothetical protein [Planctomycetota bacterium]
MNDDGVLYEMHLEMNREQLRAFYYTMAKAVKNWPGGDAFEQELLTLMRDEAWKLLLEAQFNG